MAYCRFSDADIYVFKTTDDEYICLSCRFMKERSENSFHYDYHTKDARSMIKHMEKHRAVGDLVPDFAIERFEEEEI